MSLREIAGFGLHGDDDATTLGAMPRHPVRTLPYSPHPPTSRSHTHIAANPHPVTPLPARCRVLQPSHLHPCPRLRPQGKAPAVLQHEHAGRTRGRRQPPPQSQSCLYYACEMIEAVDENGEGSVPAPAPCFVLTTNALRPQPAAAAMDGSLPCSIARTYLVLGAILVPPGQPTSSAGVGLTVRCLWQLVSALCLCRL